MMAFSADDKAKIKHYVEKGYSGYQICKQNPEKKWNYSSVKRLIKKFKDGNMDRRKGSGRPRSARTEENECLVEEMIC